MKKVTTPTKTPVPPTAKVPVPSAVKPPASAPPKTTEPVKTIKPVAAREKVVPQLFDKENYKWMLAGLVVIAIGFILMAGGKSSNPNVFLDKDVYSFQRITVAPLLIIAGFIMEIVAIMRKPPAKTVAL